ncbi:VWA domain-containing protein [Lujinxingia sediminis]|uniref:VWA domain-containing protein n=1 Tax=Lujinxingia sediminis TaxID=2480984 RepID=A0ABY0CUN5_9DELT|nr:von Willebrand factor type A domain-containing protein [Lujinxingia sediminis]RVU45752.1 VWA domain-containing protein [Lujinxingia sediminis]
MRLFTSRSSSPYLRRSALLPLLLLSLALNACGSYDDMGESGYADPTNRDEHQEPIPDPNPIPESEEADAGYADEDFGQEEPPLDNDHPIFEENDFVNTAEESTSTFSVDVNTASYTYTRGQLHYGQLPQPEHVRIEEFINFFRFDYPEPIDDQRFSINMEIAPSYFAPEDVETPRHLLRIGLRAADVSLEEMKPSNLVFLIDVSGSMNSDNRLPLAQRAMHTMLDHLRPQDSVAIQTYAGATGTVLPPTAGDQKATIANAIDSMASGGSTNGEAGIVAAYNLAESAFIEGGNNRVIIISDGNFNVGRTGESLVELVRDYRDRNITITTVGVGMSYNDASMEALARDANGNYLYLDTVAEARRAFGEELPSTLEVIAADVKIQVEFNPESVARYRLVGYEKRLLNNEDFEDDTRDAADIGPGHTVTALYEIELTDSEDDLMLSEVRIRHKPEFGDESIEATQLIKRSQVLDSFEQASANFRFAVAVSEFAAILKESGFSFGARFADVHTIAQAASDADDPHHQEFLELVDIAEGLWPQN